MMRVGLGRATLVVALAVIAVFGAVAPASARTVVAIAAPTESGLRYESHSVFTVDLPAHTVHVAVHISVTNQMPSQSSGGFIREFFFTRVAAPILSEATNLAASNDSNGTAVGVTTEDTDDPRLKIAAVDLQPDLFYGQSRDLTFTYDLPGQAPRSQGVTRVNDAFATFVAFAHGDPGATSVQIDLPSSLDTEIVGVDMTQTTQNGRTIYTADAISDPDTWTAAVSARDDSRLVQREDTVDGRTIDIKGWPDDTEWANFVDEELRVGLPTLKNLIGQPWPTDKPLTVIETAAPYLYGYAGWFNPIDKTIEIGDALEPIVILHELAHTWFNKDLFSDRWVNEAFAEEFAARALEKNGKPLEMPEPVTVDSPGAFRLNDWGTPRLQDSSTADQEHFGYQASFGILRTITTEIGTDGVAKVIDAAAHHQIAYRGTAAPEEIPGAADWRHLLDLLEEVGGSKHAADAFKQFAVSLSDADDMVQRDTARAAYHQFVDQSGGWGAPMAVRRAMSAWNFTHVDALLSDAKDVLSTRDEIQQVVAPAGIAVPDGLQAHYTSADGTDLTAIRDEAKADLDAAHHLVDAHNAVHADHGPLGAFGLLFSSVDDKLASAKRAFADSDAAATIARADSARAMANDAAKTGAIRLVALLALVALMIVLWKWVIPALRRRRRARREERAARALQEEARLAALVPVSVGGEGGEALPGASDDLRIEAEGDAGEFGRPGSGESV